MGGNIEVTGGTTILAKGNVIKTYAGKSSTVKLDGSYIYSSDYTCIVIEGNGNVSLKDTYVYAPKNDKGAIYYDAQSGSTELTITGKSCLGNASTYNSNEKAHTISINNSVSISLQGESKVMSGAYGASTVGLFGTGGHINMLGSSSLYSTNTDSYTNYCIDIGSRSGCSMKFDSNGYFYSTANYVVRSYAATSLIVKRGNFVSRSHKYMFYINGASLANHASTTEKRDRTFAYMSGYKTTATKLISECYYYKYGL